MKKIALITGASSGIGAEFAKIFAKNNYDLVLVARRKEKLETLAADLRSQHDTQSHIIPKNLSKPGAATEIFDELEEKSINIDVLINNAGTQVYGLFYETDLKKEIELLKLNIISLTELTKLATRNWIKQRKQGKILNIGSIGSFMPVPLNAIYCASKAYVLSFSEGISKDLKKTGITITTLCPGATKTEFAEKAGMTGARIFLHGVMKPDIVAKVGYKALMKGKRKVVAGFINKLMVLSVRFLPRNIVLDFGNFILGKR